MDGISLDTETTGTDLHHGAKPYMVSIFDGSDNLWWEWPVDPLTRNPVVPKYDLMEIERYVEQADYVVMHNAKFDVAALRTVGLDGDWPWEKTHDTVLTGHLLHSGDFLDLTTMALRWLGTDIGRFDEALRSACIEARSIAKGLGWRAAKRDLPEMPSAKDTVWKYDGWLPAAVADYNNLDPDHPWRTVTSRYCNIDSEATYALHQVLMDEVRSRGLEAICEFRRRLLPIVHDMEAVGVSLSESRLTELVQEYGVESERLGRLCKAVAEGYGYELELPRGGVNNSLRKFVFEVMKLPVLGEEGPLDAVLPSLGDAGMDYGKGSSHSVMVGRSKKTGQPSLNKLVLEHYQATLPSRSKELLFIDALRGKRQRDTALSYMDSYHKFWLPLTGDYYLLHPSLNPTGTATLRWSSSNPNEQNISKQEGFNLRYCFGPAPGREWWSLDAANIELRIPAYEAGETEMIELFEHPDRPPFYGSYHLLVFSVLHPEKWDAYGMKCKSKFKSTWYQWTKNGNFAVQYGAVQDSGTADRAYHVPGAQMMIENRFSNIKQLNTRMIEFAQANGYVETMPDKQVDASRGYPLECPFNQWGRVKPTVPLNYHVQGTAMWWMTKAMLRCAEWLKRDNARYPREHQGHMIMQVHDELVFDFPVRKSAVAGRSGNWRKIQQLRRLMEAGGRDIGVPTPVNVEYHPNNWSQAV